jgi:hypothetical protein
MITFYINRNVHEGPWGGGNGAIRAILQHATKNGFMLNMGQGLQPQVVLLMGLDAEDQHAHAEKIVAFKQEFSPSTRIVLRVNDCDARKGTTHVDRRIVNLSKHLDGVIFVSRWIHDYFVDMPGWGCRNNNVIVNGVDQEIFKPLVHQNKKLKIVSHHWSDNLKKSGVLTSALDDFVGKNSSDFEFTFVGRTKLQLPNSKVIAPIFGEQLGRELASHDVYFSESLAEPGPNHVLESISCGLPTYVHSSGGGAVEFAGVDHSYDTLDQFLNILRTNAFVPNTLKLRSWEQFSFDVFSFLRSLL